MRRTECAIVVAAAALAGGCATVTAVKGEKGIPFHKPQPYLLVQHTKKPAVFTLETVEEPVVPGDPSKGTRKTTRPVKIVNEDFETTYQILYLPNLDEQYGLKIDGGLGTASANFKLDHGWQLTGMDAKVDSKVAENVKAFSELIGAVSKAAVVGALATSEPVGIKLYRIDGNGVFTLVFDSRREPPGVLE